MGGRYVIEGPIGGGGMGTVYRAIHNRMRRPFAIKILHKSLMTNPKVVQRFEREAELAGRLRHTNVVSVVDVGVTPNGLRYMAMELAPGATLASLLDEGPLSESRVLDLAKQMCAGLQHAHDVGLVHRDFKPDNVIVEQSTGGRELARIVDFGVAILRDDAGDDAERDRLTTKGIVVGTPHYMAPEQARGGAFDHRVDIFALGLICYEMLTGRLPFDGDGVDIARANISSATPPMGVRAPDVRVEPVLEAIVRQMLEKDPDSRPPSANFVREMLALYESDPVAAAALVGIPFDRGPERPDDPDDDESGPAALPGRAATDHPLATVTRAHSPSQSGEREPEPGPPELPIVDERSIVTDEVAPSSSRRRLAVVGIFVAVVLAVVLWLGTRKRPEHAAVIQLDAGTESVVAHDEQVHAEEPPAPPPAPALAPMPDAGVSIVTPVRPSVPVGRVAPKPRADVAAKHASTAAEVATLYAVVGRELSALEAAKGMDATIDLWPRYRWIRINEWISTPERRAHIGELLERLRADVKRP